MIRLAFILPHLRPGGAERCVVNWLRALDRTRFTPLLVLKQVDGAFLDLLPADITPIPARRRARGAPAGGDRQGAGRAPRRRRL